MSVRTSEVLPGFACAAPAKVNLTLKVGPPAADGFHPLASLIAFTGDVADRVEARPADGLSLVVAGPFAAALSPPGDNLVLQAARLLAQTAGVRADAALSLHKHLPIASGIGGGSSDAAATLRVLNALWRLDASASDLAAVAGTLGSDAPVCVHGRTAWITGRGEIVHPTPLAPLWAVLLNPLQPAPTPGVYRAYDQLGAFSSIDDHRREIGAPLLDWLAAPGQANDLTAAAIAVAPAIGDAIAALRATAPTALIRLSGSGATVVAYHNSPEAAARHAEAVSAAHPQWWTAHSALGSIDATPAPV